MNSVFLENILIRDTGIFSPVKNSDFINIL